MARLLDQYNTTIAPELASKFNVQNKLAIPKLEKIVINMGVGRATQDKALLEVAVESLGRISGQKPQVTKAKVSVADALETVRHRIRTRFLPAPQAKARS